MGRAQLVRLDGMIARRRTWREQYRNFASSRPGLRVLGGEADEADNCWLTALIIDSETAGWSAQEAVAILGEAGIETRPIWKPMHMQPVNEPFTGVLTGVAQELFTSGLTLPSGSAMTTAGFGQVLNALAGMPGSAQ